MSPQLDREAAMDDMAAWAQTNRAPAPATLAAAVVPRTNLCAEFSALPTDKLLAEAEHVLARLDRAGRPTDYAVVAALIRRVTSAKKLDGALWLDLPAREVA